MQHNNNLFVEGLKSLLKNTGNIKDFLSKSLIYHYNLTNSKNTPDKVDSRQKLISEIGIYARQVCKP